MTILDANILLYNYNADAPQHRATFQWMEALLAGGDWIGIPWVSLWAFLRISTNARIMPEPLAASQAFEIIRRLTAQPRVIIVEPGPRHAEILQAIAVENQIAGPLMTDAVLAALAAEHGATLASTDRGFARFKRLQWVNPLDEVS